MKKRILFLISTTAFTFSSTTLFAATTQELKISLDVLWMLISAILVFFMQAGFAMVETGFTRAKNASNIIMKNIMDFAIGSLTFWLVGFGLMYGKDLKGIMGFSNFFLSQANPLTSNGIRLFSFWLFQTVFAATAATIVSGAVAERLRFSAYIIYSIVITGFIYPITGHWIWGGGWLNRLGMIDFAGSSVVHPVGGWAALIGASLLGPRTGKYITVNNKTYVKAIPGHNLPLAALGVFILWFGWFGFNAGSTLSGRSPGIALIAVTTNLAASSGAISSMIYTWIRYGKPDPTMTLNGAIAGLVAITAGCALVSPLSSIAIGFIAGIIVVISIGFFDRVLHIDDPVGAISVHGVCGAFGTIAVAIFAQSKYAALSGFNEINGIIFGGPFRFLLIQAIGVLSIFLWAVISSTVLFLFIKITVGLRVNIDEEIRGLDIDEHGVESYSGFQIFITQ